MHKKASQKLIVEDSPPHMVNEDAAVFNAFPSNHLYNIIHSIKNGISFDAFNKMLKRIPYSINDWSRFLHISDRTMQRYKKDNKAFEPIHAERIMEISLLYDYGISIFGSRDTFHAWMEAVNMAMGGIKPKDLLDTSFGIEAVKNEIGRIEYGVLA